MMLIAAIASIGKWLPASTLANPLTVLQGKIEKAKERKLKTKTVEGESFVRRANQLRRQNKGVAKAMKQLEQRGYKAAIEQGASVLAVDEADTAGLNRRSRRNASLQGEEAFFGTDYEVDFISYDNGNPSQWVGVVYMLNPISAYTWTYVLDISGDTPTIVEENFVAEETFIEPDPGGIFRTASMLDGGPACERYSTGRCPPPANLRPWLRCSAGACTTAFVACRISGPGWVHCSIAWCGGSLVGCLFAA